MRVLVSSNRASARFDAFSRVLVAGGHEVTSTFKLLARPHVALLRLSPAAAAQAPALRAAGVPIVLDSDDAPSGSDVPPEGQDALSMVAIRLAAAVIADSPASAARARALGAKKVEVVLAAARLPDLLPGARDDAKKALDLPLEQRWLAHVGPLEHGLDAIAAAHRHQAGIGLMIVAHGPRVTFAHAMTMAARPSSPVIVLGPEAGPVALWAADAVIWQGDPRSDDALEPLLLGRRAILGEDPGLYAPELRSVHTGPLVEAMTAALEAEATLGPLPKDAVKQARNRARRIIEALEAVRRH